ncbi:undecaprenol kinase [Xylanimonas cellulosilytica DSM 15894]|uniref:Undecaprenyl-diphosphatase n=1 Tax=Xylanimonas cellulosilytica (strain DSM 15894 / JCM 12276 / CECT 5975 / KCTC 9989 / LMG 20990 / NBRC 107835 / XIL07) TaxID=446471 RepID=D1BS16_XYLCX|nr:undecaprenyl-diphosphate phosphatase [Xylanimonas cellulosilytica]ACZ30508.1 undecaprenol kinase [Xylanimonas cellulosilytica DSM 15894]
MNAWEAIVLGLVQGLTEFLPISSSAHLRIVGSLIGSGDPGAAFTAITQIGTETAVVLYYRRTIRAIIVDWWKALRGADGTDRAARFGKHRENARMAWYIVLGSIPIVFFGLLLQDWIETSFRNLWLTATMLAVFALLLGWADKIGERRRTLHELTGKRAIAFGLAQSLALVPGVSRSGGTITAGLLMGFTRKAAADYAFLLAIPAVMGSGFFQLFRSLGDNPPPNAPGGIETLIATIIAFAVGYVVIIGFLKLISTHSYRGFVIYRLILAVVVAVLLIVGVLTPLSGYYV